MTTAEHRGFVFWAPRLLTIGFLAFLSLFSLDVFGHDSGFWQTLFAFAMHMIPVLALLLVLVLAWRREWIGTLIFGVAALGYVLGPLAPPPVRAQPLATRLVTDAIIAGPALLIAALFGVGWLRRRNQIEVAG